MNYDEHYNNKATGRKPVGAPNMVSHTNSGSD